MDKRSPSRRHLSLVKSAPGPLTERQQAFVAAVLEGADPVEFCKGLPIKNPYAEARRLTETPAVQMALLSRHRSTLDAKLLPKALAVLDELLQKDVAPATRLAAVRTVLDFSSIAPKGPEAPLDPAEKDLSEMSPGELQEFIRAGSVALEELRSPVVIEDAEFTEHTTD